MNLSSTVDARLVHNNDGLDFLIRDKNTFHARDCSVIFNDGSLKDELELRVKHNLAIEKVEGKCLRAVFYDFQRQVVTNPIEAPSIRTMELGNAVEKMEVGYYKSIGIFHSAHNRMFNKEYQISGEIDNLIWEYQDILLPDGSLSGRVTINEPRRLVGVEIKSFYGYYAEKEILNEGKPKWNHVLQSLVYLDHYKPHIPYWLLVYSTRGGPVDTPLGRTTSRQFKLQISKASGDVFIDGRIVKEFNIDSMFKRFKEAQFYLDSNKLPSRDYVYNYPDELVEVRYRKGAITKRKYTDWQKGNCFVSDWQCQYCNYLAECWQDVHGDKVRGAKTEVVEEEAVVEKPKRTKPKNKKEQRNG